MLYARRQINNCLLEDKARGIQVRNELIYQGGHLVLDQATWSKNVFTFFVYLPEKC